MKTILNNKSLRKLIAQNYHIKDCRVRSGYIGLWAYGRRSEEHFGGSMEGMKKRMKQCIDYDLKYYARRIHWMRRNLGLKIVIR